MLKKISIGLVVILAIPFISALFVQTDYAVVRSATIKQPLPKVFELRFFKPFEETEPAYMTTESVNDSETKVSWGFNGHIDYPMNLIFLFVDFEDQIGGDLQEGLQNLKVILEK